jgi:hypothetical protein
MKATLSQRITKMAQDARQRVSGYSKQQRKELLKKAKKLMSP